ncbi:MAG: hypothetical protein P8Z80_18705 [Pseudolabrys sp.]
MFLSIVTKPLLLVMLLLCGATQPRMCIGLALALLAALLLPFAFADMHYVAGEYRSWIEELRQLAAVTPGQWPYQAGFATPLDTFGIGSPQWLRTGVRLAAALGTLALVWRVARLGAGGGCAADRFSWRAGGRPRAQAFLTLIVVGWLIWLKLEPKRWVEPLKPEGDHGEEGRLGGVS